MLDLHDPVHLVLGFSLLINLVNMIIITSVSSNVTQLLYDVGLQKERDEWDKEQSDGKA